jgi:autotransporter-associated beta strand protein
MGANNALPNALTLNLTVATGILDLAGFNQSVDTLTGPGIIANSSTVADGTFTAHPSGVSLFPGVIRDSVAGGTRKVGLTVSSGTLSLQGTNTYTGPTTILAGSLQLVLNGSVSNTATIYVAAGANVDVSTRSDGTFTLNPGQTLKGDGAFNVLGNLVSAGTIELKLNKSGVTLASDSVSVSGSLTYGGTLKVDLTASPAVTTSDSFALFSASGGLSGAFIEVIPAPGFGLAWDTSTLSADGTLRVKTSSVPSTGTNITAGVTGNQLSLSWPANYIGWRLQAQTNGPGAGLSTNWVYVTDSSVTNQVFFPLNTTLGSAFYRLVYP